jgi:hypothetical protein
MTALAPTTPQEIDQEGGCSIRTDSVCSSTAVRL